MDSIRKPKETRESKINTSFDGISTEFAKNDDSEETKFIIDGVEVATADGRDDWISE